MGTKTLNSVIGYYDQLVADFDQQNGIMWCYMNPHPRPCFNQNLLKDLQRFLQHIRRYVMAGVGAKGKSDLRYIVFGSHIPGVFSLGGDLKLFLDCIGNNQEQRLRDYMKLSIDVMYSIYTNIGVPITTISLIRGNALGAGFEGALSCDFRVAEKGVQLGFPEVLFNMFPGMGAYSFLARMIDPVQVEKMILSGRIYSTNELTEMGIIDGVADVGGGEGFVISMIKRLDKTKNTRDAVKRIRQIVNPVSYNEMLEVGELWVDAAMSLTSKERRVMERLIKSQDKMTAKLNEKVELRVENIS